MSYATYLRNKLDAQPKVLSLHNPTDASQHTHKKRLEANQVFFADGHGKGTLSMAVDRPTDYHAAVSFDKGSTRPADASDYTSFRGHIGVDNDSKYLRGGKTTIPSCCSPLDQSPDNSKKYKTAADVTRDKLACDTTNSLRDPPLFVDTTIRLSAMHPEMVGGGCCDNSLVEANHQHSEGIHPPSHPTEAHGKRSEIMRSPPGFQNQGVGGARIGAYYTPKSGYVENKHGNDLNVNPKRIPTRWVFSRGAPAHLKINNPTFANVKPS